MGKHSEDKRIKMKKGKKYVGRRIFILILILLIIAGIVLAKKTKDLGGGWSGLMAVFMGHNEKTAEELGEFRILILGESTGLTDTIIVASYNPVTQKASMLSIPRDTFTGESTYSARASHKINSLAGGGESPEKTLKEVNEITGLDIENYVYVDTEALIEIVDAIGGLEFDVPIDMKYDDYSQDLHINLKAGKQNLSGKEVEGLVRFRHNNDGSTYSYEYGIEDYGRMHTQRNVITELAKQVLSTKKISEITEIINIVKKYVKTNVDLTNVTGYLPYAMNFDLSTVSTQQLPGESKMLNGISFFLHDEEETEKLIDEIFLNQTSEELANEIDE